MVEYKLSMIPIVPYWTFLILLYCYLMAIKNKKDFVTQRI